MLLIPLKIFYLGNQLNVSDVDISNDLNVSGSVDISNNLNVSGNVVIVGNLNVSGELFFDDVTYENMTITNLLNASGVDISNNLNVSGNVVIDNNLTISGNMIIEGTISGNYLFVDDDRIHIGYQAGERDQCFNSIAIGPSAGYIGQNQKCNCYGLFGR